MNKKDWLPLKTIYVRQGVNIAGHQNRIYDNGPTWDLHLHPQGAIVSLLFRPQNTLHFVPTSQIETAEAASSATDSPAPDSVMVYAQESRHKTADPSGLVSNQVAHQIAEPPAYAAASAEILAPVSETDQALDPEVKHEMDAKAEHLAPEDPPKPKKKRGRPRKVAPPLSSEGASF